MVMRFAVFRAAIGIPRNTCNVPQEKSQSNVGSTYQGISGDSLRHLTLPKGLALPLVSIASGVREDLPKLSFGDRLCKPRDPYIHAAGLLYHLMAEGKEWPL
ncbi:MAG: hypothetical protein HY694_08970 [Deltaproteobacteria bacterium]|nr:hypothetical protein [Deltaproteobacteria bacterium]